ncbi:kinesin KP1-like isoform X1 [Senna tora]|uniref:Kinesin KP1-like isoform X1 n=1 Tax=Senna tora TaxID=362788 RepID=A0A834SRP1_9FABA|nr:kinesin KP1-like isoform X1 [Senna tora]
MDNQEGMGDNTVGDEFSIDLQIGTQETGEVGTHSLLEKIISDEPIDSSAATYIIIKSCSNPPGLDIVNLVENTLLFNFKDAETAQRIMNEAPSNVLGKLLCLQKWSPELTLDEVHYCRSPFWIQIHNVPPEGFSMANVERIARKVGDVMEVEKLIINNKIVRGFMRARVMVDITKPLETGYFINRRTCPPVWANIFYEKLEIYCCNCGCIGHEQKICKKVTARDPWDPDTPRYGPCLGVPPSMHLRNSSLVLGSKDEGDHGEGGGQYAPGEESGAAGDGDGSECDGKGSTFERHKVGKSEQGTRGRTSGNSKDTHATWQKRPKNLVGVVSPKKCRTKLFK